MRLTYRILAFVIAAEVAIQAAVMVYAVAGLGIWVQEGGVLDKAVMESDEFAFPEVVGFMLHGMNGMMVIPVIALLLLIASFFAKVPRGVVFALIVAALVALQIFLGIFGHEAAFFGMLHGLNALVLFSVAVWTGVRARRPAAEPSAAQDAYA
ncbi:hypothetical protein [Glycomyces terrestris]|uniref:DUF4386 family protein n=1 Tax=Glycomyces terrestris TaxID=2493553 RepID=A0A426UWD5_9ACTN|nr:hypothetical protein [Glycomyces terrestris]RRR98634.1 hypothetical protein EIW28_17365 [Glycomyces terrestris]